ncbi:MAG: hypothetical protein ACD_44C00109G0002 [uncultured bacterium]|nr:MAG: hypothetical protein ACD_44C00109G0002 [uncultured bacterium]
MSIEIQPELYKIPDYLSDISVKKSQKIIIDLSANENALGPSPMAVSAFVESTQTLSRYPDGECRQLRLALANKHILDPNQIACGAGSDELISLITRAFVRPGDEVLFPEFGFIMYKLHALKQFAIPIEAPSYNLNPDIDTLLSHITKKTKLIFIANPNNPTGSYLPKNKIKILLEKIPKHIPLVIDSAYSELIRFDDYSDSMEFTQQHSNLIILKTFSKIYALAALRVGWCYGSHTLIDLIHRVRGPYNVSTPAQQAAIAALKDDEHTELSYQHNKKWLAELNSSLINLGLRVTASVGNFILLKLKDEKQADHLYSFLLNQGILVRPLKNYNLNNYLRITVGLEKENLSFIETMKTYVCALKDKPSSAHSHTTD